MVSQTVTWREIWESLRLSYHTFAEFGLHREAPDSIVWQACQDREVALITGNRNKKSPDSLETTLRSRNTSRLSPRLYVG